jgi:chromosome segregation ATPase
MKINDVLREASDDSSDYQQMLAFTRANRVGGVPDDQQIPLALFKELKRQQQQNQALGSELSAAEQRIDQAMQSGELSRQELGMHRGELERERAAGDQQKAAVTQLGQQYSERERASTEQIEKLTGQLEQVKTMPGVDKKAADELEKQIKELGQRSVPVDRLAELESSIAQIQNSSIADDTAIQDLVSQVKAAQETTKELEKNKQSIKQDTQDQVEQIRQQLAHFREVEQTVAALKAEVDKLEADAKQNDQAIVGLSGSINNIRDNIKQAMAARKDSNVDPQMPAKMAPQMVTPKPPPQRPIWNPDPRVLAQKLVNKGVLQSVDENQLNRAIEWATGKKL